MSSDSSLIQLVHTILSNAQDSGASDIHIEPFESLCRIRYRQHGVLRSVQETPPELAARITTRLKVMAKLDIAERRLPQDGRFHFHGTDIRINTCPILHGEKCVLRLLQTQKILPTLENTGMSEPEHAQLQNALAKPDGMILVTGPTGSGKTTTLYAALNYLNQPEKNIATVEDPVEIQLPNISQVNLNTRAGLTFATTLRALLRQDPDILMIGEIRDEETASIAIQAAQTGHLVLSTLHTGSTTEALLRLHNLQIPPHHIAGSVRLIISQRLLRIPCTACQGKSCEDCTDGFTGRTAIFEFLPMSTKLAKTLIHAPSLPALNKVARKENPISLRQAGLEKIRQDQTTHAELLRVLGPEEE